MKLISTLHALVNVISLFKKKQKLFEADSSPIFITYIKLVCDKYLPFIFVQIPMIVGLGLFFSPIRVFNSDHWS